MGASNETDKTREQTAKEPENRISRGSSGKRRHAHVSFSRGVR